LATFRFQSFIALKVKPSPPRRDPARVADVGQVGDRLGDPERVGVGLSVATALGTALGTDVRTDHPLAQLAAEYFEPLLLVARGQSFELELEHRPVEDIQRPVDRVRIEFGGASRA